MGTEGGHFAGPCAESRLDVYRHADGERLGAGREFIDRSVEQHADG